MSHENTSKAGGEAGSLPPALSAAELNATLDSLSRHVQQLIQERDSYLQALEIARAERDEYRHQLYAIMRQYLDKLHPPLTEEEIQRMIAEEKWSSLEDFIDEIEKLALGS